MNYRFIGKIEVNDIDSDKPFVRSGKTKTGAQYKSLNIRAKNDKQTYFLECFGMVQNTIKTKDVDNKDIEIDWDDRFDEEVVKTVANYRTHVVSNGDERKVFITDYDFIEYVAEHIEELKAGKVQINGQINKNVYNGTISDRFQIQNIYVVDEDTKPQMRVTLDEFWTVDDIDTDDWKEEKKVYINGYTQAFLDKNTLGTDKGATKYVSQQVIFDASKIDYNNEKHVKLKDYKLKMLGLEEVDGKIKAKIKPKKVYKMGLICNYVNGAEEVPFDESQLTETQKEAIELGIKSIDDFRPKGNIYGNRVTQYKVVDFNLNGDYVDGIVTTDMTQNEFEEDIFVAKKQETVDDIMPAPVDNPTDDADDDIDNLFS